MKLNETSSAQLKATIRKAIGKYTAEDNTFVTDIHLQANASDGVCRLFDDDDQELGHTTVNEWVAYEGDDFDEQTGEALSIILHEMKAAGDLDSLQILKPYSFVQVDDDK